LDDAAEYVAKSSAVYAAALVQRTVEAVRSLVVFAERGAPVEELEDSDFRERYVDGFRLIYAVRSDIVFILAFIHSARDFSSAWSERERPL